MQPRPGTIAPSLLIGLTFGVYGMAAFAASIVGKGDGWQRWNTFYEACVFVQFAVLAYGAFAAATRLIGYTRGMMLAVGSVFAIEVVWYIGRRVVMADLGSLEEAEWRWLVGSGELVVALGTILLTIGTRAWRLAPVAAVFALIAVMCSPWMPYVNEILDKVFRKHQYLGAFYLAAREVLWAGCVIAMLNALAKTTPVRTDVRLAATALRRTVGSLVVLAGLLVVVAIAAPMPQDSSSKMIFVGPAVLLLASIGVAWALFEAERARVIGLPRVLMALGALAMLWSLAMRTIQALTVYQGSKLRDELDGGGRDREWWSPPTEWTVMGPIVGLIGGFLVALALRAHVHHMTEDTKVRGHATMMATLCGILGAASTILAVAAQRHPESKLEMPAQIAAAIAAAISLLAIAGIARALARLHDEQPALPTARLRS